jgi:broad specificity phosphatase PhoE
MSSLRLNTKKQVWFFRHGRTDFDYENCSYNDFIEMLQDGSHVPLIEGDSGINLEGLPRNIGLICHSPARRAVDTAEMLKGYLNVEKVIMLDFLHEVKFDKTIIQEHEFTSLKDSRLPILTRWFNNQNEVESFEDSLKRVKQIELFLQNRREKNILLITHGWFLRLLDIYFIQGKEKNITLSDLLDVKPMALGQSVTTNIS